MAEQTILRVLVQREYHMLVAQCLELDIGAQAKTLDELQDRFEATLQAELAESTTRHGKAFAGIPPAPQHFFDAWDRRQARLEPVRPSAPTGPTIEMGLCA